MEITNDSVSQLCRFLGDIENKTKLSLHRFALLFVYLFVYIVDETKN